MALTLRLLCGLTTGEVARAFLVSEPTMAARITRAKKKIAAARIPYRVPDAEELPARVDAVLAVVHLLFTTGHTAPAGGDLVRRDLVERALDLARMLRELLPTTPTSPGCSRCCSSPTRAARPGSAPTGGCGCSRTRTARTGTARRCGGRRAGPGGARRRPAGPVHAAGGDRRRARRGAELGRHRLAQIVASTALLAELWPSPVVALNRAVALGFARARMRASRHWTRSARTAAGRIRLPRRVPRRVPAPAGPRRRGRAAYEEALLLTENEVEREFLGSRDLASLLSAERGWADAPRGLVVRCAGPRPILWTGRGVAPPRREHPPDPRGDLRCRRPVPATSITMRIVAPPSATAAGARAGAVGRAGGVITGLDVVESTGARMVIDLSANALSEEHAQLLTDAVAALDGVAVRNVSDRTFLVHLGGKIEVTSKVPPSNRDDLSRAYTPGVARVSQAIAANPADARRLTIKRNTVAVVTDVRAVLGLGDVGPAAALPVMEGKAALLERFAGVDAWPLYLSTPPTPRRSSATVPARRRRCTAASTSRTSRRRAASTSRHGCGSCWTSRCSTTTSTAPRSCVVAALRNALRVVGKDVPGLQDRRLGCRRGGQRDHPAAAAAAPRRHRRRRHPRDRPCRSRGHGPEPG